MKSRERPEAACADSRMPPASAPPTVWARRRTRRRSRAKEFSLAIDVVSSPFESRRGRNGGAGNLRRLLGWMRRRDRPRAGADQAPAAAPRPPAGHRLHARHPRSGDRLLAGPAALPAAARRRARGGALRARVVGRRLRLPRRAAAGESRPSTARRRSPSTPGAATSSSASTRRSRRPGRPSPPRTRCCSRSARPTRPASARSASSLTG